MSKGVLWSLIKVKLSSVFYSMTNSGTKKNGAKKSGVGKAVLYGLLFLYLAGIMLFYIGILCNAICVPFCSMGLEWFYFGIVMILALMLCFIGSVFMTQSSIYRAKDNDLLLSMPIKPGYILLSRMLSILSVNYVYAAMVFVPAGVVYCMNYTPSVIGVILFVLLSLLVPLLSQALACLVAWLLELVSSKMRNKNIVILLASLVALGLYFMVIMRLNEYLTSLIMNGTAIAESVKKAFFPAYFYGMAISEQSLMGVLITVAVTVGPAAVAYYILSKNFVNVVSTNKGGVRRKYIAKEEDSKSPMSALLSKELSQFTSSASYMLNAGLGGVFALVLAVVMIFNSDMLGQMIGIGIPTSLVTLFAAVAISFCVSMNIVSAPTISLEAKTLWISKTIPVDTKAILMSKVYLHLIITAPFSLISSLICAFILKPDIKEAVLLIGLPLLMTLFGALFGLVMNLAFPKFNWNTETQAVKQGMSVFFTMMGSMALVVAFVLVYSMALIDSMSPITYAYVVMAVMAVICVGLYAYIETGGVKRYMEL